MSEIELAHFDDFKDVILDYIHKQKYDSDEIKNGIVAELMGVFDIYNTKYKTQKESL
jgi:hypothetical protein